MLKIETHLLHIKYFILFVGLVVFHLVGIDEAYGQIPRAGFPYCQGFLNMPGTDPNSIQFTVARGDEVQYGDPITFTPRNIEFTGQGIRLVKSEKDLRGYLFIDLPFSATYGIKTSFEYFVHTPSEAGLGDGFSFFLFDGSIDKNTFEIGGVGGSLGYAPLGSNDDGKPFVAPKYNYTSGGLKGGYLGIGFDVLGNFGNFQEKKYGGFYDPNQFNFSTHDDDIKFYPNAVSIRGPVDPDDDDNLRQNGNPPPSGDTKNPQYDSYKFIDGKIVGYFPPYTYTSPVDYMNERIQKGSGDLYSNPTSRNKYFLQEMFELGSGLMPTTIQCNSRPTGYRKAFIDLQPTGNPLIPYSISVYILKDQDLSPTTILSNVPYPHPLPANARLKMGFSASTGGNFFSAIDIRNVAALVSSVDEANKPAPPPLFKEICIDDQSAVELPFCVTLADNNTFIQCIQLLDDYEPSDNNFDDDFFNCEQPGFCDQRCLESKKELEVRDAGGRLIGIFKADLSDEVELGKFDEANITFERVDMSFYGTITRYYKIVDNFGLESDAIPITVTINPNPTLLSKGTPQNPTCDGQQDGALTGVQIGNLVDDPGKYTIEFYDETNQPVSHTLVKEEKGADGFITATFDLPGLNLGKIYVRAINPSSTALGPVCDVNNNIIATSCVLKDELLYEFKLEEGTPVLVNPDEVDICEGADAVLTPTVDPKYLSGTAPSYKWYTDKEGMDEITASTTTIDGENVQVTIDANGVLTISGLTAGGTASKTYDFFVETAEKDNGSGAGNFCPYIGDVLSKAEITVYPAISASVVATDDWCLDGSGSITVTAAGGSGDITFSLFDSNGNPVPSSSASQSSGEFLGLAPDDYVVEITSTNPPCVTPITASVQGPTSSLALTAIGQTEEYCDLSNGSIEFSLSGGNTPYTSITVNGAAINTLSPEINGNTYKLSGLNGGDYVIEVLDAESCPATVTMTVPYEPPAEFAATDAQICEGQIAVVRAETIVASTEPVTYKWFSRDDAGNYLPISNGQTTGGATFTINGTGDELSVAGLTAQATPYMYYVQVEGDKVCTADYLPAEISVSNGPAMDDPVIDMVQCFGGDQGAIQAVVPSDNLADFEFSLVGDNGINFPFAANGGLFENLTRGTYTLSIRLIGDICTSRIENLVITEPDKLDVVDPLSVNPTCGNDNGKFSFEVVGGVAPYQLSINNQLVAEEDLSQAGNTFELINLSPGTFSVSVSDANACLFQLPSVTLTDDAGIDVTIDPIEEEYCEGQVALLTPVFQTAPAAVPIMKWYKDQGLTLPITSSSTPDPTNLVFQIDPTTGTLEIEGLAAGDYSYFLEISGQRICTRVYEAKVTINDPIVSTHEVTTISCYGSSDGSITVTPTGGSGVYEYSLDNGAFTSTNTFTDLAAGSYTITVRDEYGCQEVLSAIEIEEPATAIAINTPDLIRSSCGLENGSIENLTISGGWENYTVAWKKGDAVNGAVVQGTLTGAKNLGPDFYYLLITDIGGCTEVFEFEIEASSDPVYDVVPPIDVCAGEPVSIRPIHLAPNPSLPPAAATEVKWYKSTGQQEEITTGADGIMPGVTYTIDDSDWIHPILQIDGLSAGQYTYYFYVVCTGQEIPVDITVYDTPAVELLSTPITCFNDTNGTLRITSGALADYSYAVDGGAGMDQAALENRDFAAGTYELTVSTPAGCAQILNFEIEGPDAALAVSPLEGVNPGCGAPNGKLDLKITGGYAPYTIDVTKDGSPHTTLNSSDQKIQIDGLRPGVYQVTVTDDQGCNVTSGPVTLVDGPTQVLVDDQEICEGEQAILLPSIDPVVAGVTYNWYFDAAQSQPINSSPSPAADGNIYEINSSTGELTITGLRFSTSPFQLFVSAAGNDICGGFVADPVINVFSSPSATAAVSEEVCYGEGGTITVDASGGSGKYTFSLNGGPFVDSPVFQTSAGTHSVEVRTPEGCNVVLKDIIISGPSAPLAFSNVQQANPSCDLQNGQINFDVTGGYPPYIVAFSFNGVQKPSLSFAAGDPIVISGLGKGSYEFSVTDDKGCVINHSSPIDLIEAPTVIFAQDTQICTGETASLTPTVPSNISNPQFSWFFDAQGTMPISSGTQGDVEYTLQSDGSLEIIGLETTDSPYRYFVSATGVGICNVTTKEVKVEVFNIPVLRVSNPSIVCDPNGTVDLTDYIEGFNPSVYDYNVLSPSGNAMQIDELENVAISGDYKVSSSAKGSICWNQPLRIKVIISDQLLEADFQYQADLGGGLLVSNGKAQILEDIKFEDLSMGKVISWGWNFGDGTSSTDQNPTHQYQEKGVFTVTLTTVDEFGCVAEIQKVIEVIDDYDIIIPNAFTPTGVKNNYFKPKFRGIVTMEFYIFSTWGELIYETDQVEDPGWDGLVNGKPAIPGNYVYKGVFKSKSGERVEKAGTFVLIR